MTNNNPVNDLVWFNTKSGNVGLSIDGETLANQAGKLMAVNSAWTEVEPGTGTPTDACIETIAGLLAARERESATELAFFTARDEKKAADAAAEKARRDAFYAARRAWNESPEGIAYNAAQIASLRTLIAVFRKYV